MSKSINTTPSQFLKFKKFAEIWQKKFGLTHIRIYYQHKNLTGAYADTVVHLEDAAAWIRFSKKWYLEERPLTDTELNRLALHEMLHVLLWELQELGKMRESSEDDISQAEHLTVRRLENILS